MDMTSRQCPELAGCRRLRTPADRHRACREVISPYCALAFSRVSRVSHWRDLRVAARILSCNLVSAEKIGVLQGRRPLFRFADTCALLQLDGLDAAALRRLRQRLRPRAHAQLSEQRFDMKLHSMERDVQPPCY